MKKYNNYKDSGIEWIGEIPEHWDAGKFNLLINIRHGHQFMNYDFKENGIKIIKITQLHKDGYLNISDCSFIESNREKEFENILIKDKDILMCLTGGTIGKIIRVGKVTEPLIQNYRVGHFSSADKNVITDDFIFWTMSSNTLIAQIFFQMRETGQPNIGMSDFSRMKITIPTVSEQITIANYLDHKNTQLDQLINQKQRFIELLQEERTAVINQAVTKGLDPTVKMKDSGIEWLGEIPEHWKSWKIGHAFNKIGSGTTPESGNPLYHENGTINWLNTGDLNDEVLYECNKKVTEKAIEDYTSLKLFPSGSLVMAMYGATIGKTALLEFETTTNQACCVFCQSEIIDLKFLQFWFKAKKEHVINLSIGGGQPNVSQQILKDIRLGCPNLIEQNKIVEFLKVKTNEINTIISKSQQEIELLKEYKTALISEVVTGKIDVSNVVLNQD
jgi:type I restriction enzyme S subunit